ncbi:MAG TPA: FAD-dependent oxidoreductase [Phycisphaerae bacterium]|nr:FAD-dependent oxidoreductase [Phycisphaerae bacterium]
MNVAVLGGGIAGLTAAYRLAKRGESVTLFEASDRLGGLGTWFEHDGDRLDKFYHVILDSDQHLLGLIEALGLTGRLAWSKTTMGFIVDGEHYAFNTPLDLLRFGALSIVDRIRTGLAALYITKLKKQGEPLDNVPACDWLRKLFGPRVYRAIWEPLLTAKFGDERHRVPAYWIWNTLNREKNGSEEIKAAMRGGLAVLTDALADAIRSMGCEIRTNCKVNCLWETPDAAWVAGGPGEQGFDAIISTLPLPLLRRLADVSLAPRVPMPELAYQGVVNVLLVLKEGLDRHYWTAVVDSGFSFQGVVETTHVIRPEWIGGRHLVYAMNYCAASSPQYKVDDDIAIEQAIDGLRRLYTGFRRETVDAAYVFRAPHVEPVWTRGYLQQRPAPRIEDTRLFLATTAQAYPMVTSWNTSVKLADDAVDALLTSGLGQEKKNVRSRFAPAPGVMQSAAPL